MKRLLVATRSIGKLRELRDILAKSDFSLLDLNEAGIQETAHEGAIECFERFEENSLAKARHFYALSGITTVADDSGLSVGALGGRPGVRSKRYSERPDLSGRALDDANNALLLRELENHQNRSARYVCAAAFIDDDGELVTRGECEGTILDVPRGSGGFGYDPYFLSTELGQTLAEVSRDAKAVVSHRARAFRALLLALRSRR
ncbi:MAG: non-canonical purine NTP pyrophosphatase [Gemmatimonadaceae bacterium]